MRDGVINLELPKVSLDGYAKYFMKQEHILEDKVLIDQ